MFQQLPPLQALRALEAAERHRNFSRAAEELHLTHSAISHHVRLLENRLGTALFERVSSRMHPTSTGRQLAEQVRHGLTLLETAFMAAHAGQTTQVQQLEVSVMADFAYLWLIPQMQDFHQQFPHLDFLLRIHAEQNLPDLSACDVGIWHQPVIQAGFSSYRLMDDTVIVVASPMLIARYPKFNAQQRHTLPLLRFTNRNWHNWFVAAGWPCTEPERGPLFDDPGFMLKAAVMGQGFALARRKMAASALACGELVQVSPVEITASMQYFVSWRDTNGIRLMRCAKIFQCNLWGFLKWHNPSYYHFGLK